MSFKEKNNAVTNLISLIIQKTGGENTEQLSNFLGSQQISNSFYEDATGENLQQQIADLLDQQYQINPNFDVESAKQQIPDVTNFNNLAESGSLVGNYVIKEVTGSSLGELTASKIIGEKAADKIGSSVLGQAASTILGPVAIVKFLFDLTKYFTRDKYEPILQKTLGDMARYDNDVGNTAKNFLEAGYGEDENMQDIILNSVQTAQDYYDLRDKFFVGDFDSVNVRKELAIPYSPYEPEYVKFDDVKIYLMSHGDKRGRENVPYIQANNLIKEIVGKLQTQKDNNLPLTDVFTDFGIELTDDDLGSLESISDILGTVFTGDTDKEEVVDVADDDTTETLLADTTKEDTTENITEEIVEKIEEEEEVVEDETEQDKEPKTNVWRDSLEQARKEARERAKEQERIEQEKLAEQRREKGYDDLSNTGKSIFDKMVEMGLDPDVNNIQYNYTGFGDFGPNHRNISSFFNNYYRWKSEQARKTVESDTPILDSIDSTLTDGISIRVGDKTFKIPIFGGSAKEGLNATVDADGNVKVSIGVNKDGVIVEQELGSLEEVQEKINTSISEGKTKVEDAQEDISSILSLLFGTKKNNEEEEIVDITTDVDNKSDVDNNNKISSGGADDKNEDKTKISDVENEDKTKVSLAGLFGGFGSGGKGAQPELGKFQPLSIVNPVAPVSAADMYRRPQYVTKSLFSEYFK